MMYWHDNTGWMSGIGMLFMIVFLVSLIVLGGWAVVRLTGPGHPAAATAESPRQILDRRFASGEIDAEQYALARRVLEGRGLDAVTPAPPAPAPAPRSSAVPTVPTVPTSPTGPSPTTRPTP